MSRGRKRLVAFAVGLLAVVVALWLLQEPGDGPVRDEPGPFAREPARGRAPELVGREAPEPPAAGESTPVTPSTLILAGRVIEDVWAVPVEGAHVFVAAPDDECVVETCRTDAEGRFRFETLHRDSRLEVVANGFLPWKATVGSLSDPEDVIVRLDEGGSVSGVIVDDLGEPVPGVRVHCHRTDNEVFWPKPSAWLRSNGRSSGGFDVTSDRGAFTIHGLEEGVGYDLGGGKEGWTVIEWGRKEPIRAGERGFEIVIRPLGTLLVRYVFAEGASELPDGRYIIFPRNTRPYSWWHAPELPDGRKVIRFARDVRDPTDPTTGTIRLDVSPHQIWGHEPADVEVRFLETTEVTIPVERVEPGPWHDVSFEATGPDGAPFTGSLWIRAQAGLRDTGVGLDFADGKATTHASLPTGRWTFTANGTPTRVLYHLWWPAAPAVELELGHGRARAIVRFALRGAPCRLKVRNREGIRVCGYRYGASIRGRHRGGYPHGIPDREGTRPEADPVVWLPEGSCRVYASIPGVGRGAVVREIPGDGTPQQLSVVLDQPRPPRRRGPFVPP